MPKTKNNEPQPTKAPKHPVKAGKHKPFTPPNRPNPDKQAARQRGEQQFVAKSFPTPLPAVKGSWDYVLDILCDAFDVRRMRTQNDDCGYRYDPTRKRYVAPPKKKED